MMTLCNLMDKMESLTSPLTGPSTVTACRHPCSRQRVRTTHAVGLHTSTSRLPHCTKCAPFLFGHQQQATNQRLRAQAAVSSSIPTAAASTTRNCHAPASWLQHTVLHQKNAVVPFPDALYSKLQRLGVHAQWDACNASATQQYMAACAAGLASKLPLSLTDQLHTFLTHPNSPTALLIQGFPIDTAVPPTPLTNRKSQCARLPVAEGVVLGVAKLLGDPFTFAHKAGKLRGGLVTDLTPKQHRKYHRHHRTALGFHQDFPRCPLVNALVLLCVRGDPTGQAVTHICNNRELLAALEPADAALLRSHHVQLVSAADGSPVCDMPFMKRPEPWLALTGADDDPVFRFYEPVLAGESVTVSGANAAVTNAYYRTEHLAGQLSVSIRLTPGDVLVINNQRCLHARSAFTAQLDGSDRWVLRVIGVARRGDLYRGANSAEAVQEDIIHELVQPDPTLGMRLDWPELHITL